MLIRLFKLYSYKKSIASLFKTKSFPLTPCYVPPPLSPPNKQDIQSENSMNSMCSQKNL